MDLSVLPENCAGQPWARLLGPSLRLVTPLLLLPATDGSSCNPLRPVMFVLFPYGTYIAIKMEESFPKETTARGRSTVTPSDESISNSNNVQGKSCT